MSISIERLKELGLEKAAMDMQNIQEFDRKCAVAYEKFRYVTQQKIDEFQKRIRVKTEKKEQWGFTYDTLKFTDLKQYSDVPPESVLSLLESARKENCFDYYEVAKIESVKERVDPILFGRIKNCPDRFFIGQWDTDVKIEDILKENEG
jgi:hypothetical protein